MDRLETFSQSLFDMDLSEIQRQLRFHEFVSASLRLDGDLDALNLVELRKQRFPATPFVAALQALPKSVIKQIGPFRAFVDRVREATASERDELTQELTGSSAPLSHHLPILERLVQSFNRELPFAFPVRFEYGPQLTIFRVAPDITPVSSDFISFRATTSLDSSYNFLIQRSRWPDGLRPCVTTIATVLSLFRQLLQVSYPARQRALRFSGLHLFEVGPRMVLVALQSAMVSLRELFEVDEMRPPEAWLAKYIVGNRLTDAGRSRAARLPRDSLTRFFARAPGAPAFIAARTALARSYASAAFVRHVLGAPYPALHRVLACWRTGEVPVLATDFDLNVFPADPAWSPVRLSPVVAHAIGPAGRGEFQLALGAVALALAEALETVRTFLEIIIADLALTDAALDPDALLRERGRLEAAIVAICPPCSQDAPAEECVGWLGALDRLIERATDSEEQPFAAIPWY
jgi:hypothetical protein